MEELWIAPRTSLTRDDTGPWRNDPLKSSDARFLELADIALGFRKPQSFRRRRSAFLHAQSAQAAAAARDEGGNRNTR